MYKTLIRTLYIGLPHAALDSYETLIRVLEASWGRFRNFAWAWFEALIWAHQSPFVAHVQKPCATMRAKNVRPANRREEKTITKQAKIKGLNKDK